MVYKFNFRLFLFSIFILPTLSYANFTIAPVKLKINNNEKIAAISVKNNTNEAKSFQLIIYKVIFEDGKEVQKETKDLIVTPAMFKIPAGKTQLIRVAIKSNNMYSTIEDGYKISVKELPRRLNAEGAHVQLVTEFKVPVSISSQTPETTNP